MDKIIKSALWNLFLLLICLRCSATTEYIYPVAQLDDENLLLMYQKSFDDLELWVWNRSQKLAFKELNSFFLPSYVQVLPSKNAYSFLDRGRIRIKQLNKRAPRAIDIYEPIHAIVSMTWIDDEQFYFVGKHENHFNLFLCNTTDHNVQIFCLNDFDDQFDYLYPCKIQDSLFCITKDAQNQYSICKLCWDPKPYQDQLFSKIEARRKVHTDKRLGIDEILMILGHHHRSPMFLYAHNRPLCFLTMINEHSGFVLELATENETEDLLAFNCCMVEQNSDEIWELHKIFDFKIAKKLLLGQQFDRLYESIYPFLPVYSAKMIYFVDYNQSTDCCNVQCYDRISQNIEPLIIPNRSLLGNKHIFAPCLIVNTLYCGISCMQGLRNISFINIDPMTGVLHCELPEIIC